MDNRTVRAITNNAQISALVFSDFLKTIDTPQKFQKYFHLRPTSNGITIVSTLPDAPMRGISAKNADDLIVKLKSIHNTLAKLLSDDNEQVLETLKDLGFKKRGRKSLLEEDAQAAFIRGMIANESAYQGIQFVASELNLEDKNRFDIVGYRPDNNTLYLFELKKGRTTAAVNQAARYCTHVAEHKEVFEKLLSAYPNRSVGSFSEIKGIAVMEYAENSKDSTWNTNANQSGIEIWMYCNALSFPKRYPQ